MTANTSFIRGGSAALALAWALAFAMPAAAEVAGKVLFVAGTVTLERAPPAALKAGDLAGLDALLSTAMMPPGVPVATVAIGSAGARNAVVLAARILALKDPAVAAALEAYRESLAQGGK